MEISSFDIFDTCLIRKCGTPENFFDVFSLRAFDGDAEEWARQEFVAARVLAQQSIQSASTTLQDIWDAFSWTHPLLKSKDDLYRLEQDLEREMLVPVLAMRDKVNNCRKCGDKIIFISDMYLSSEFLISVLRECGFFQDGDALYVSCECNASKWNGELFQYVKEKEGLKSFRHWHHYGDNKVGDYKAPKKLGIKCTLINHEYTPYQKQWKDNDYSLGFKYPSILAGLGRALHYSTELTTHTDFVLDIIAPFYCSLVYRMMKDAKQRGIKRLYFCARDAYEMHQIALKYKSLFPGIDCRFLYISKKSLYEGDSLARQKYFEQIGLANTTDYVAIVDFRSSGKTLQVLNEQLSQIGCLPIKGYYFEMFCTKDDSFLSQNYYSEINSLYISNIRTLNRLLSRWNIYEQFFPLNTLKRTIDYYIDSKGIAHPVFDSENEEQTEEIEKVEMKEKVYWADIHHKIIEKYVQDFTMVANYSDEIFNNVCMPTIVRFFETPDKHYLGSLDGFYASTYIDEKVVKVPYISKINPLSLLLHKANKTMWRRATLIYSIPKFMYKITDKIIHGNA